MAKSDAEPEVWYRDDLGTRDLHPGNTGDDVGNLQAILASRYPEFALGLMATGIYDDCTETCVKELQARDGLKVDGIAGPETFAALSI